MWNHVWRKGTVNPAYEANTAGRWDSFHADDSPVDVVGAFACIRRHLDAQLLQDRGRAFVGGLKDTPSVGLLVARRDARPQDVVRLRVANRLHGAVKLQTFA